MLLLLAALVAAPMQDTDTTFAVRAGGGRLNLDNFEGSVTISTWSRSSIRIQATHDDDTRVEVENRGSGVWIRGRSRYGPAEVSYRITVPAEMSLEISSHEGEVQIDGTRGDVQVSTVEGAITLKGGRGRISLTSVEGDLTVAGAEGRLSLTTVDGVITLREVAGDIDANTVDGDILIDGASATNVDARSVDGDITYNGVIKDGGHYQLSAHDGDVTVRVPSLNASVSVSTFGGEFDSDFPVTLTGRNMRKRMDFTLGSGTARLELESFDGMISLRKGSGRAER
jgi:DUF4097 and DUF4098 domain-containing protein YvlB